MRRIAGFGLIDMMISLFLSTLLVSLLMQHVLLIKRQGHQAYVVMNDALELHWVSALMRQQVRVAGFTPCLRLDHLARFDAREHSEPLEMISWHADAVSSTLTLRRMSDNFYTVKRIDASGVLHVEPSSLSEKHAILLADCYHAEVHEIAHLLHEDKQDTIVLKEPLMFDFHEASYVGEWISESFFIRHKKDSSALFYQHHRVDEISSHVHQMRVDMQQKSSSTWLNVLLFHDDNQLLTIKTVVRAS